MAFDITIQHDLKKLSRSLSTLEKRVAPQATVRTLNRVAESAKVASARHIAPQMNSRQAGVKRRIETQKATFKRLWAARNPPSKRAANVDWSRQRSMARHAPTAKLS